METLVNTTCGTFLEELASKAPTPGGGAASALCGAVAAALTAMLANLTVGKAGSEENEQQTAQIIAAAGKLREELTALADDERLQMMMRLYSANLWRRIKCQKRRMKKKRRVRLQYSRQQLRRLMFPCRLPKKAWRYCSWPAELL